jgi:hypothetical protein
MVSASKGNLVSILYSGEELNFGTLACSIDGFHNRP